MSKRLESLEVGSFFILYKAETSRMLETLCRVVDADFSNDDKSDLILKCVCLEQQSYSDGITVKSISFSNTQDLKFTPVNSLEAQDWMMRRQVATKLDQVARAAWAAYQTAHEALQTFGAQFRNVALGVLEHAPVEEPRVLASAPSAIEDDNFPF